jgi:hypothetical protein
VIGLLGQSSTRAKAAERKSASEASKAVNMDWLRRNGELATMLRQ